MKKIIIGALLIMSITVSAQQSTLEKAAKVASEAIDTGKKMVNDGVTTIDTSGNFRRMYTDIKEGIVALASSLKVGAEHVYEVLVKQQKVYAIVWTIVGIISLALITIMAVCILRLSKKQPTEAQIGIAVFESIISVILFIVSLFHLDTIVTGMINPEYGAIKDILDIVKPK